MKITNLHEMAVRGDWAIKARVYAHQAAIHNQRAREYVEDKDPIPSALLAIEVYAKECGKNYQTAHYCADRAWGPDPYSF